jgi:hypothetical protein
VSGPAGRPAQILLPLACLAGAIALGASEFMNTFALRAPGAETESLLTAGDRHHYALLVVGIFAVIALVIAVLTGSKPAAVAVAACGAFALVFFLVVDLPDAGKVGTLNDARQSFIDAKAYPVSGFYLELVGAAVLALCGGALATLRPEQIRVFGDPVTPPIDRHGELG